MELQSHCQSDVIFYFATPVLRPLHSTTTRTSSMITNTGAPALSPIQLTRRTAVTSEAQLFSRSARMARVHPVTPGFGCQARRGAHVLSRGLRRHLLHRVQCAAPPPSQASLPPATALPSQSCYSKKSLIILRARGRNSKHSPIDSRNNVSTQVTQISYKAGRTSTPGRTCQSPVAALTCRAARSSCARPHDGGRARPAAELPAALSIRGRGTAPPPFVPTCAAQQHHVAACRIVLYTFIPRAQGRHQPYRNLHVHSRIPGCATSVRSIRAKLCC